MNRVLFLAGLFAFLLAGLPPAQAQTASSVVVATCGTPPTTYVAGQPYPDTQNTSGLKCTNGTFTGTVTATIPAWTHAQSAALAANLVVKNAAGNLGSFEVAADSTLSGAAWWVMIYDAATAPADGAVTPAKCYAQTSGTTQMGGTFDAGGVAFTTGIVIGVSTTGCFAKTQSIHAYIAGDYQ